jgi:hypothetical protein
LVCNAGTQIEAWLRFGTALYGFLLPVQPKAYTLLLLVAVVVVKAFLLPLEEAELVVF